MVLEGPLVELMVKVDPKLYSKYVTINSKGNSLLYAKMHKYHYVLLISTLIFYKNVVNDLEVYGFIINPYNTCVANMEINGSQMTLVSHINNLKVSHKDPFEVTRLASYMNDIYVGLKVNRGKLHNYLGMDIDYSVEVIVKV